MPSSHDNVRQPRELWNTITTILGAPKSKPQPTNVPSAQNFLDFFNKKVEAIRKETGHGPATTFLPPAAATLNCIQLYTQKPTWPQLSQQRCRSRVSLIRFQLTFWDSFFQSCCLTSLRCVTRHSGRAFYRRPVVPSSRDASRRLAPTQRTYVATDQYLIWPLCPVVECLVCPSSTRHLPGAERSSTRLAVCVQALLFDRDCRSEGRRWPLHSSWLRRSHTSQFIRSVRCVRHCWSWHPHRQTVPCLWLPWRRSVMDHKLHHWSYSEGLWRKPVLDVLCSPAWCAAGQCAWTDPVPVVHH